MELISNNPWIITTGITLASFIFGAGMTFGVFGHRLKKLEKAQEADLRAGKRRDLLLVEIATKLNIENASELLAAND
jgi:hypothetical protein